MRTTGTHVYSTFLHSAHIRILRPLLRYNVRLHASIKIRLIVCLALIAKREDQGTVLFLAVAEQETVSITCV
eukprot:3944122-Amphidinium_carterae.1